MSQRKRRHVHHWYIESLWHKVPNRSLRAYCDCDKARTFNVGLVKERMAT